MRRYLLILLVLFGAIVGVLTLGYFREPTLGLDLQGGLEVVLEARPEAGQELTDADLDRSVEIIRQRVDKIGVSEPEIRKQEPNQIVVDLAGVFDAPRAAALIVQTAQLEFYDLQVDVYPLSQDSNGYPVPSATLLTLLTSEDKLPEWTTARGSRRPMRSPRCSRSAGPSSSSGSPKSETTSRTSARYPTFSTRAVPRRSES